MASAEVTPEHRAPVPVILATAGAPDPTWEETIQRAAALTLARHVELHPSSSAWVEALQEFPQARVAVAAPPRASLQAALALATAERAGVVVAPLHDALATAALPPGARHVQLAHGWATTPGRGWFARALEIPKIRRFFLEIRGALDAPGSDLREALFHALALVRRWFPEAALTSAKRQGESRADLALSVGSGPELLLAVHAAGQHLDARVEGDGFLASWRIEKGQEVLRLQRRGPPQERSGDVPLLPVRALRQLVMPDADLSLADAQRTARLHRHTLESLDLTSGPGARSLEQAARLAARHPEDALAPLGLAGALPSSDPAPVLQPQTPPEPLEFWLFQAGVKPVVFLTLTPEEEAPVAHLFAGAAIERRERRVHVGPQDAWTDRRDLGERRIELYISREPGLAAEAARLQSAGDPSQSVGRLGDLMGYPRCCVEAFGEQPDRSNNTHNRYATASRTRHPGPWPWELNNLHTLLIPFYPCRYDCPAALSHARAALSAMDRRHPGTGEALRQQLCRPVLYFDDERQICFEGSVQGDAVHHRGVAATRGAPGPFRRFAGALSAGDELRWTDEALLTKARGSLIFRLQRIDPGLGWLAPFGLDPRAASR